LQMRKIALQDRSLTHMTFVRRTPPVPSIVYDTYWRFAAERQAIYHRRITGRPAPWTADAILAAHKFTNAYRAADRVSQYLIQRVIYARPADLIDTVFRILFFKLFNKPSTWELLESRFGEILSTCFSVDAYDSVLNDALRRGHTIYSGAYIMPSGPISVRTPRKHRMHLELLARALRDRLPERLATARSMGDAYHLLLALPGIGPFLAFQFVTDLNYSAWLSFSEMTFVVPGPGARDGLRKCFTSFGDYSEAEVIRWVAERQDDEFAQRGLKFVSLWSRSLQLIDCQNLFCEVDKYARVAHPEIRGLSGRSKIKQRFVPDPRPLRPWFPPKWELNERIGGGSASVPVYEGRFSLEGQTLPLGI